MVQVDAQGMLNDQNIRDVVNTFLEEASSQGGYSGPQTMEEILSTAESESELDPQGFNSMTMFMKVEGEMAVENYLGMLFTTDWSFQEMVDAAGGMGADVEEGSYQGVSTYTTTDATGEVTMIGDLGDGSFVLGTQNAVEGAIDVSTGNGNAVSGDLADYFDQTSGGYMRFASMIPQEQVPESGQQMNVGFQNIRFVSGSFYSEGSNLGIDMNLHTNSNESASNLSTNLEAALNFLGSGDQNPTAQEILNQIEFSVNGSTVTISYVESVSKINSYVEQYAASAFTGGMGGGGGFSTASASA